MNLSTPSNGDLLIAEPSILGDTSFNRSVVLLADHTEKGTVGFIMNKPLDVTLADFIPQLSECEIKIFNGGPVEQDNLYFIHTVPELIDNSIEIAAGIYWGGNFETVIKLLQEGRIDKTQIQFFLGYSGWDAHQLDDELEAHSWIVSDNRYKKDILGKCCPELWKEKIMELGGEYLIWSNAPENPNYN